MYGIGAWQMEYIGELSVGVERQLPSAEPSTQELLKAIGRASGKGLSTPHACLLYQRILAGSLTEQQVGAALMAMRIRGEGLTEILGALQALEPYVCRIQMTTHGSPAVVIPSYNGARLQPNLVPLLACLIADEGIPVLVHGVRRDSSRLTSAEIFHAMGIEALEGQGEALAHRVADCVKRGDPAFVPIDVLSPALASLLERRRIMGVRNTGHTLVKLLQPIIGGPVLQLASYTHADFHALQQSVMTALGLSVLQSRGCEGEVVLSTRRVTAIELIAPFGVTTLLAAEEGSPVAETGVLPNPFDAVASARWTQSVLAGEIPTPRTIQLQVDCIKHALAMVTSTLPEVSAYRAAPDTYLGRDSQHQ
jgi:anthranilate phosphoribosyltransferase